MEDKYGINIKKWARGHQAKVEDFLSSEHSSDEVKKMLGRPRTIRGFMKF